MNIKGIFIGNSGVIDARFISHSLKIDYKVSFLVDTGASNTVILDRDAIRMKINYTMLSKSPLPLTGIGGEVPSYIIEDSTLIFGTPPKESIISMPLYVTKHPLERMEHLQKNQILRMPSLLGRDIIEKFKLTFDVQNDILMLS